MTNHVKAGLLTTGLATILATGAHAIPLAFEFEQGGYGDNGVFSGYFIGEDLDEDGQINAFNGEVMLFEGAFVGDTTTASFSFVNTETGSSEVSVPPPLQVVFFLKQDELDEGVGVLGDDARGAFEIDRDEVVSISNDDGFRIDVATPFEFVCPPEFCDLVLPPGEEIESVQSVGRFSNKGADVSEPVTFTTQEVMQITISDIGTVENPFLPNIVDEDGFIFDLNPEFIPPREIFWFDPEIAVGYTYEITGAEFDKVQAPFLSQVNDGDGKYTLYYNDKSMVIDAGEIVDFEMLGVTVTSFRIEGIDVDLALDPEDVTAFVTGLSYRNERGAFQITQTPITVNTDPSPVPLPAGGLLLLSGLAGIGFMRRRKNA